MTRQMRRALALTLAGALFSAGAWGQSTVIRQYAESIDVASEYFGTADGREVGRDIKGETGAPKVILAILDEYVATSADDTSDAGTGSIGQDNTAQITYQFRGATFAETVSASNLDGVNLGSTDIETEVVSGGAKGDSSVTIEVKVVDGNIGAQAHSAALHRAATPGASTPTLVFEVPMLQVKGMTVLESDSVSGAPTHMGVSVKASIAVRRATDNPFPTSVQGLDADDQLTDENDNVVSYGPKADKIGIAQSQVYSTMAPALTFAWGGDWGDYDSDHRSCGPAEG